MNKERYNQIIDEAWHNYLEETFVNDDQKWLEQLDGMDLRTGEKGKVYRQFCKQKFINKCKIDVEFSERWNLFIEETYDLIPHTENFGDVTITKPIRRNKLIVVYKNETIEVYE